MTFSTRPKTHEFGRNAKVRLQIANEGPTPNASEIVDIPVNVDPYYVTPWGEMIPHGQTRAVFGLAIVPFGTLCPKENCVCNDGALSGSAQFAKFACATTAHFKAAQIRYKIVP